MVEAADAFVYGLSWPRYADVGCACAAVAVAWLMAHALQKVVVVVTGVTTGETLERWAFDIEADKEVTEDGAPVHEKPMKEITKEIAAIMRQITSSVTFLPMLGAQCVLSRAQHIWWGLTLSVMRVSVRRAVCI